MTLDNLLKVGRLHSHTPAPGEIGRLLSSASRNLQDAAVEAISIETRFDAAYKAMMQSALVALLANGFRPSTSEPGHHVTVLQTLPKTIGISAGRLIVMDALRKRRNLADYAGMEVDEGLLRECIAVATALLSDVTAWLGSNRPTLLP